MIGYHVTTPKKLARYHMSGVILPPVRFWPSLWSAQRWARKTGRSCIIKIYVQQVYPLPDHRPAYWTPEIVTLQTIE